MKFIFLLYVVYAHCTLQDILFSSSLESLLSQCEAPCDFGHFITTNQHEIILLLHLLPGIVNQLPAQCVYTDTKQDARTLAKSILNTNHLQVIPCQTKAIRVFKRDQSCSRIDIGMFMAFFGGATWILMPDGPLTLNEKHQLEFLILMNAIALFIGGIGYSYAITFTEKKKQE
eukprot:NODE_395_length_8134_cov_0.767393.p8 type:complete len:173 gc:universal NODE_395_length_8134_cov_0.767393:1386-1904(+)